MRKKKLVEIKNLKTHFKVGDQWATAVHGVDFDIMKVKRLESLVNLVLENQYPCSR